MTEPPVALITGSSRGIGAGIAKRLGTAGFKVILHGRQNSDWLNAIHEELKSDGVACKAICFEQSDLDDGEEIAEEVYRKFGRLDCLVNNAGTSSLERIDVLEASVESLDVLFKTNIRGQFLLTQALAKRMIEQETRQFQSIIFITSSNATAASVTRTDYCMMKAAASMMARSFAVRLAQDGICVYEVRPGLIYTDMTKVARASYDKKLEDGFSLINRWGTVDDVAKAIEPLAMGAFEFSTGSVFYPDGGLLVPNY